MGGTPLLKIQRALFPMSPRAHGRNAKSYLAWVLKPDEPPRAWEERANLKEAAENNPEPPRTHGSDETVKGLCFPHPNDPSRAPVHLGSRQRAAPPSLGTERQRRQQRVPSASEFREACVVAPIPLDTPQSPTYRSPTWDLLCNPGSFMSIID